MRTWSEFFTVSPCQIWDMWDFTLRLSNESRIPSGLERLCLSRLWDFLESKGELKSVNEFRQMIGYTKTETYALRRELKDLILYGIYFGNHTSPGLDNTGPYGILMGSGFSTFNNSSLEQEQKPDYKNSLEKIHFERLFPLQLIAYEGDQRDKFLQFQLDTTFHSNKPEFLKFLNRIKADSKHILTDSHTDVLNDWISEHLRIEKSFGSSDYKQISPDSNSNQNGASVNQYALEIVYRQLATGNSFAEGELTKEINKIAKEKNVSATTLKRAYTAANKSTDRLKLLGQKKVDNITILRQLLADNNNAKIELERDINKLRNPLP